MGGVCHEINSVLLSRAGVCVPTPSSPKPISTALSVRPETERVPCRQSRVVKYAASSGACGVIDLQRGPHQLNSLHNKRRKIHLDTSSIFSTIEYLLLG